MKNAAKDKTVDTANKFKSSPGRPRLKLAGFFLALLALAGIFFGIAAALGSSGLLGFDRAILEFFRQGEDPSRIIGPSAIQTVTQQATDIGSGTVMAMWSGLILGYMLLDRQWSHAAQLALAAGGGAALGWGFKQFYQRPRPEIVPRLGEVHSWSFPSGHANLSMIIFLTLGVFIARYSRTRLQKIYVMAVAVGLVLFIGWSRIALGVHYPSDVLAGWTLGAGWALIVWFLSDLWEARLKI